MAQIAPSGMATIADMANTIREARLFREKPTVPSRILSRWIY
jgi:hypothetical protein